MMMMMMMMIVMMMIMMVMMVMMVMMMMMMVMMRSMMRRRMIRAVVGPEEMTTVRMVRWIDGWIDRCMDGHVCMYGCMLLLLTTVLLCMYASLIE